MAGEGKKVTKGDKTKKLLYDCAMELFREKGYDQVSVAEIVKKAGTAKGTFYIYFASKPEVLFEMLREYDDYYDQVASRFPETLSVQGRLEKIAMSAGEFTSTVIGFDLIRVLYTGQMTGNLRAQLYTDRSLYRIIREELERGQRQGTIRREPDSEELTNNLVTWIRGTFFEWVLRGGSFDLSAHCGRVAELFYEGVRA